MHSFTQEENVLTLRTYNFIQFFVLICWSLQIKYDSSCLGLLKTQKMRKSTFFLCLSHFPAFSSLENSQIIKETHNTTFCCKVPLTKRSLNQVFMSFVRWCTILFDKSVHFFHECIKEKLFWFLRSHHHHQYYLFDMTLQTNLQNVKSPRWRRQTGFWSNGVNASSGAERAGSFLQTPPCWDAFTDCSVSNRHHFQNAFTFISAQMTFSEWNCWIRRLPVLM